ncbi:MAG: nucleotidyltransferase family protein [Calditrichota bacterium]
MSSVAADIGAVILAAGRGRRIGEPKALLPLHGSTFLEHIVNTIRSAGITDIAAVVSDPLYERVAKTLPDCAVVVNPNPDGDMLSSVRIGLKNSDVVRGVFIVPVDHPFVEVNTYRRLMTALTEYPNHVVIPEYNGSGGHPILVPSSFTKILHSMRTVSALNRAIKESGLEIVRTPVNDAGILKNVNTAQDLEDV